MGTQQDMAAEEVAEKVFRLPLPTGFDVGPVNAFLFARDEPALVDCGPKTDEAWSALLAHLDRLGMAPARLRHLVATHSHIDHHGNLARLAALAPEAAIRVHEDDAVQVLDHEASMAARVDGIERFVRLFGYAEDAVPLARRGFMRWRKFADSVPRARFEPIRGEDAPLALGATHLRAIHAPGHTEGLIVLLLEERGGILFSSDHILERITPNPTIHLEPYRGRRTGLGHYVASLARLRDLSVARVEPGHGAGFGGFAARIDEILLHHEERKRKIVAILEARGPRTVLEIALELWPDLPPYEHYMGSREVLGHLDLLIEANAVREEVGSRGAALFLTRT